MDFGRHRESLVPRRSPPEPQKGGRGIVRAQVERSPASPPEDQLRTGGRWKAMTRRGRGLPLRIADRLARPGELRQVKKLQLKYEELDPEKVYDLADFLPTLTEWK